MRALGQAITLAGLRAVRLPDTGCIARGPVDFHMLVAKKEVQRQERLLNKPVALLIIRQVYTAEQVRSIPAACQYRFGETQACEIELGLFRAVYGCLVLCIGRRDTRRACGVKVYGQPRTL